MLEVLWAAVTRGFPLGAVCGIEKKGEIRNVGQSIYKVEFEFLCFIDFTKHLDTLSFKVHIF